MSSKGNLMDSFLKDFWKWVAGSLFIVVLVFIGAVSIWDFLPKHHQYSYISDMLSVVIGSAVAFAGSVTAITIAKRTWDNSITQSKYESNRGLDQQVASAIAHFTDLGIALSDFISTGQDVHDSVMNEMFDVYVTARNTFKKNDNGNEKNEKINIDHSVKEALIQKFRERAIKISDVLILIQKDVLARRAWKQTESVVSMREDNMLRALHKKAGASRPLPTGLIELAEFFRRMEVNENVSDLAFNEDLLNDHNREMQDRLLDVGNIIWTEKKSEQLDDKYITREIHFNLGAALILYIMECIPESDGMRKALLELNEAISAIVDEYPFQYSKDELFSKSLERSFEVLRNKGELMEKEVLNAKGDA